MKKFILSTFLTVCLLSSATAQSGNKQAKTGDWLDQALAIKKECLAKSNKNNLPFESKVFRRGDAPEHIEVDLVGLDELALLSLSTPDGVDYDHATWADAKFIAADGTETWLSDVKFKYKRIESDWFCLKVNFNKKPFSIADKHYTDGVIEHANGFLLVDLRDKNWVKFVSDIGVDNGATDVASVQFRIQSTLAREESRNLMRQVPNVRKDLLPYINGGIETWLTTPGTTLEKSFVEGQMAKMGNIDLSKYKAEMDQIGTLTTDKEKILAYIDLVMRLKQLADVKTQIQWLNPVAVNKAFADFSKAKGYDKAKWQAKLDTFNEITKDEASLQDFVKAKKAVELKREIMLSNPVLLDSVIVTRYNLGGSVARRAMAPQLGTQANNWSCQLSAARSGFDADLVMLTGIRSGNPTEKVIFEAQNGDVITDARLHWNADRVLFTSTDELKRYQVYEVNVDGTNHHQVSIVDDKDLEFFDAQYLPSGKMVVCSNLGYHGVPCVNGSDAVGNYTLYDPNTHQLRRLTFDQDNNWNATVLNDGKVMYTRWEYTDLTHYYSRIVFTMNPDGTEQRAHFGSGSMFPNSTFDMQQLPQNTNRFIGVISGHHGIARSGRLIIFDPVQNRAGAAGMVQEIPHSKRPIETLVKDQLVDGVWPQFLKPHPLNDKYFLVTAKLSPESLWGIYLVDIYDNMTLVIENEGEGYINSIPYRKTTIPPTIPEKIPMDLTNASKEATVFIQDLYFGEGLKGVPRGTVKQLRIFAYEYDYLHTQSDHIGQGIQSGWDIKRLLGYVPVESDGSALFKIPANTPISIQPIDSLGRAIQWMRSWTIGMPGEEVSCVGCHENRNQIAMGKRTIASQMTTPHELTPDAHGVRAINFEQDIQPILNRACVACHNSEKHPAGIDYTPGRMDSVQYWDGIRSFSKSYLQFHPYFYRQGPETEMEVLNPYEYSAYNSDMPQMLRAGHHNVKLTDEEMRTIYLWLDFNVPYYNRLKAEPHKIATGDTLDQKQRRMELAAKYSGNVVNWEKELSDYQKYLDAQPAVTPVLPEKTVQAPAKEIKVKNFPFDAAKAKEMQGENATMTLELAPGITVDFVRIPAGSYIMGNDKVMSAKRQKVTIKKPFWMATTELSNAQVRTMLPKHDSRCIGQHWKDHTTPGYPVNADTLVATKMSYNDCMEFCRLISEKWGKNVTIPDEQQWEWAARAGSDQDFWFGDLHADYSEYENMGDSQLSKMAVTGINPQPMSRDNVIYKWCAYIPRDNDVDDHHMLVTTSKCYKPNPWGLYDMNGNVAEWTRSVFYPDPTNTNTPEYVVRGGSWYDRAKRSTCSSQRSFLPWIKVWNAGIRLIIEE